MAGQRQVLQSIASGRAPDADPVLIASAIDERLGRDAGQRADEGAATRRALQESFSLGPWVARVLEHYDRALARRDGGSR